MAKQKSQKEVIDALRKCGGIITKTAEMLGLASIGSFRQRIKNSPVLMAVLDEIRMDVLDKAEDNVITAIKEGDKDLSKWYLTKIGRERGYGEALEIKGELKNRPDLSNLSEEQLEKLEEILRSAKTA